MSFNNSEDTTGDIFETSTDSLPELCGLSEPDEVTIIGLSFQTKTGTK